MSSVLALPSRSAPWSCKRLRARAKALGPRFRGDDEGLWPFSSFSFFCFTALRIIPFAPHRNREGSGSKGREAKKNLVVPAKAGTQRLCLASALRSPKPSVPRRRADGKAACPARGRREGSRRFDRQARMACRSNPSARSEPAALRPARYRGRPLFRHFLWASRESGAPARMAGKTHRDVSRFSCRR
jgi:hypothetical protein